MAGIFPAPRMSVEDHGGGGADRCWLLIGLGNPGPEYEATYHNVGFRVIEILTRRLGASLGSRLGKARVARVTAGPAELVLVQPCTYMNRSGAVLDALFERFGSDSRVLVVSDDLALPIGRIRVRERGSAGGHNGLKSISSAYGSDEYLRVRVGILPERPIEDTTEYVLSRVAQADRDLLGRAEVLAADAVEDTIAEGALAAMSKYNGVDLRRES